MHKEELTARRVRWNMYIRPFIQLFTVEAPHSSVYLKSDNGCGGGGLGVRSPVCSMLHPKYRCNMVQNIKVTLNVNNIAPRL